MKYYERLIELGCFTRDDVEAMCGNRETAHSIIEAYKKKGWIASVRRNLFVAMSLETKQPVPTRFAIASNAAPGAYVCYHSAFEYHGLANQVYHEVYAAAKSRFRTFEYYGLTYRYVQSFSENGVESMAGGARVTDLERTVIDCLNDFDKAGGLDELLRCIEMIPYLESNKLLEYLSGYNKLFLYQKTGFVLEHFKNQLKLTNDFFTKCQSKVPNSKRYMSGDIQTASTVLNKTWGLYAPKNLLTITKKGDCVNEKAKKEPEPER